MRDRKYELRVKKFETIVGRGVTSAESKRLETRTASELLVEEKILEGGKFYEEFVKEGQEGQKTI